MTPGPALLTAALVAGVAGLVVGRVLASVAQRVPVGPDGAPAGTTGLRAPWVQLGTGVVLAAVVLRVGLTPALPAWLWFAGCAVLLAVVDLAHLVLPNRVLLPATVGGVGLLTGAAAATGDWADLGRGLLAAVALFTALLVLALVAHGGLGMGDVKLGVVLGLYLGWTGWPQVLLGLLAGFVLQSVASGALLATRRVGRRTHLPLGPALLAGTLLVGLLVGGVPFA